MNSVISNMHPHYSNLIIAKTANIQASGWIDLPKLSETIENNEWVEAERSPVKCNDSKFTDDSVNSDIESRTSTPVPTIEKLSPIFDKSYEKWKMHLSDKNKSWKIRGISSTDETIISAHIDMEETNPFSYTFEEKFTPNVNKCFVNLLLNGLASLECVEHTNFKQNGRITCNCIPVCNCREKFIRKQNVPSSHKYDQDGFVVPKAPLAKLPPIARNPFCIYTD